MTRPIRALREAALWIAAAIGTLCLLAAVAAVTLGMTPLIFRSGSMSPGIPTGSLGIAVSTPASDLRVGDVVSVVWPNDTRVTHRLQAIDPLPGGQATLTTKGDANDTADVNTVTIDRADRVVWSAPGLGFVLQEVTKPQWVFGIGVVVGVLVLLAFRKPEARLAVPLRRAAREPATTPRHARGLERHRGRAGTIGIASVAALALTASLLANAPTGTLASFVDPGTAASTFATTSVQAPTGLGCVVTGAVNKTVTFSWTPPAAGLTPTGYLVSWTGLASGSSTVATPSIAFAPGLLALGTYTFTVTSQYGSNWSSSPSTGKTITWVTSILVTGC